jgi:hypothetical protein
VDASGATGGEAEGPAPRCGLGALGRGVPCVRHAAVGLPLTPPRPSPPAGVSFSLDAPAVPGATAAASAWSGGAQVVASGRIPKSAFTQQLELQAGVEFDRGELGRRRGQVGAS